MTTLPEHPYPLVWPDEIPRTRSREKSAFRTELRAADDRIELFFRRDPDGAFGCALSAAQAMRLSEMLKCVVSYTLDSRGSP